MEGILAISLIFGGGTIALLGFTLGPIGRAIGDSIRRKSQVAADEGLRAELAEQRELLNEQLEGMRREMAELSERVDFAERLLAKNRGPQRLAP